MQKDAKVLALIPARGGSKGIPGKNIKNLCGMPLIAYTIAAALKSDFVDDVVVTTDDEEIASVAKRFGAWIPFMRPPELAMDESKTIDCVVHARDSLEEMGESYDALVLLQPTSPLRAAEDIDAAMSVWESHGRLGLCSVSIAESNPLLLRVLGEGGVVHPVVAQGSTMRRQDVPTYYRVNGSIYINRFSEITLATSLNDNPIGFVMPRERSIDIDTFEDFRNAEKMIIEMSSQSDGERVARADCR